MSTPLVFIDGEHGTTGLSIRERLASRSDVRLLSIDHARRKDPVARREALNSADVAILCLPDDAAREAVASIESPRTRVIDASTAHRVAPNFTYGFAELTRTQRSTIAESKRVSNPGCYPTGFIALVRPLRDRGLLADDAPIVVHAVSGYSGGGRTMIDAYENPDRRPQPAAFGAYALTLAHKHLAEMQAYASLQYAPLFSPAVASFRQGMLVFVPVLFRHTNIRAGSEIVDALAAHYRDEPFVSVRPLGDTDPLREGAFLEAQALNGTNALELFVFANDASRQALLVARLDNLGKGAGGSAVQNLNLMLGRDERTGLLAAGESAARV